MWVMPSSELMRRRRPWLERMQDVRHRMAYFKCIGTLSRFSPSSISWAAYLKAIDSYVISMRDSIIRSCGCMAFSRFRSLIRSGSKMERRMARRAFTSSVLVSYMACDIRFPTVRTELEECLALMKMLRWVTSSKLYRSLKAVRHF